jgi:hypothetical protein
LVRGEFAEAVQALTQTDYNDAYLLLAIAYMRLNRSPGAHAEVEKMMKVYPAATVQAWRQQYCFRDPEILNSFSVDLTQAGLPKG